MTTPPDEAVGTAPVVDAPAPIDADGVDPGRTDASGGNGAGAGGDDGGISTAPVPGKKAPRSGKRVVIEWVILVGGALLIAFLIKTFLFQAFWIPSESMLPTLEKGDRVLVNKLSYDLHDVNRGDIVVFENPNDNAGSVADLVKRVVGLPGDTVELVDGAVYVDGEPLDESYTQGASLSLGNIPGCEGAREQPERCRVPAGTVFVMGDNRQQSEDSRKFGPIDESTIVGRVFVRIWPVSRLGLL